MQIPQPHWKKTHNCWYLKYQGKFHRLDPDEKRAKELYPEVLARVQKESAAEPASPTVTVNELLGEFLEWTEKHRAAGTLACYQKHLSDDGGFANFVGDKLRVRDLKPFHVTRWLDKRYSADVSSATIAGAITAVKRAFNWAKDEGYIQANPIASVKKPHYKGRGDASYLTPEQWATLVQTVNAGQKPHEVSPFLDYVTVMKETGCRPQEIRMVEARHLDHANKQWVFPESESKGKKEKRIVGLGDLAYGICQRLALKNPTGPLFLNSDGKPWTNFALNCRCRRLSDKVGFKVFPYAVRHTFATQAILNGVDLISIQKMMGHKDLTMLSRIYQHVTRDKGHMERARAKATGTPATGAA